MNYIAKLSRAITKTLFKLHGLATIKNIPTEAFNVYISSLIEDGWIKHYEYSGFDAWIDYGCVKLKKNKIQLKFEWDNWSEGSIEGPASFIKPFAKEHNLSAIDEWRWAEYDDN